MILKQYFEWIKVILDGYTTSLIPHPALSSIGDPHRSWRLLKSQHIAEPWQWFEKPYESEFPLRDDSQIADWEGVGCWVLELNFKQ